MLATTLFVCNIVPTFTARRAATLDTGRATIKTIKGNVLISCSGADSSDSGIKYSSKIIYVNDVNIVNILRQSFGGDLSGLVGS
jgi:hypothetical protein